MGPPAVAKGLYGACLGLPQAGCQPLMGASVRVLIQLPESGPFPDCVCLEAPAASTSLYSPPRGWAFSPPCLQRREMRGAESPGSGLSPRHPWPSGESTPLSGPDPDPDPSQRHVGETGPLGAPSMAPHLWWSPWPLPRWPPPEPPRAPPPHRASW